MARKEKTQKVQLDLLRPERSRRGRRQRGRARGTKRPVAHRARRVFSPRHPLHVTYGVREEIGRLRRRDVYEAIKRALRNCCARDGFRICHYSVQGNHLHLLVEANDKGTLSRGMQGFGVSVAKQINRRLGRRKGAVFGERYGCKVIEHPRQVRATLAYVLNNWRKHRADADAPAYRDTDDFSSAAYFDGWTHRPRWAQPLAPGAIARPSRRHEADRLRDDTAPDTRPLVAAPRTAFLASAWQRYGRISPKEVPAS